MRKQAPIALALFLSQACLAFAADEWLNPPPAELVLKFFLDGKPLPKRDIYEVPLTRFDVALHHHLVKAPIVRLDCKEAEYFLHGHYECPQGKDPYLVRAVYTNPGTGAFGVIPYASDLLITHGSLGAPGEPGRVALIVNLASQPARVFIRYSGAM